MDSSPVAVSRKRKLSFDIDLLINSNTTSTAAAAAAVAASSNNSNNSTAINNLINTSGNNSTNSILLGCNINNDEENAATIMNYAAIAAAEAVEDSFIHSDLGNVTFLSEGAGSLSGLEQFTTIGETITDNDHLLDPGGGGGEGGLSMKSLNEGDKKLLFDAIATPSSNDIIHIATNNGIMEEIHNRDRSCSWGAMSDLSDRFIEASTVLAASALTITGIAQDLTAAADGLDCIPSPLDSPSLTGYSTDVNTPPLALPPAVTASPVKSSSVPTISTPDKATLSSANIDINAMIADAVAAVVTQNSTKAIQMPSLTDGKDKNTDRKDTGTTPTIFNDAVKAALDAQEALLRPTVKPTIKIDLDNVDNESVEASVTLANFAKQISSPRPKPVPAITTPIKQQPRVSTTILTPNPVQSPYQNTPTPLLSNRAPKRKKLPPKTTLYRSPVVTTPQTLTPQTPSSSSKPKGQSNQKWEEMYMALQHYITLQNDWDGNVPTHYKTPDGKALGRWIGNQRAAKHKGSLKPERMIRLESTGLKWTVLSTNAWSDMMNELRLYVKEKTKDGTPWNGNVPTAYKIKSNTAPDGTEIDEEKNLGRWINRQRSLYQCGRLKKDRQLELEKIGLKWSVLSTTTWETMFESLRCFVYTKKACGWDGYVPANYKTNDVPPKNLGRWVSRQRMAFAQDRLSKDYQDKLLGLGLKLTFQEHESAGNVPNVNRKLILDNVVEQDQLPLKIVKNQAAKNSILLSTIPSPAVKVSDVTTLTQSSLTSNVVDYRPNGISTVSMNHVAVKNVLPGSHVSLSSSAKAVVAPVLKSIPCSPNVVIHTSKGVVATSAALAGNAVHPGHSEFDKKVATAISTQAHSNTIQSESTNSTSSKPHLAQVTTNIPVHAPSNDNSRPTASPPKTKSLTIAPEPPKNVSVAPAQTEPSKEMDNRVSTARTVDKK